MTSDEKETIFVRSLLEWGVRNRREFPWRSTKDPYKILVAEILLQRTKAEQVAPIYEHFIERFPSVLSLSLASLSEITDEIHALGLKKRAQGLRSLAKQLNSKYHGRIPKRKDELIELPWIGDYIANALLCHAYDVEVPTVDSNFARVLVRVFSIKAKQPAQKDKRIWKFAQSLMPIAEGRACDLNLAILDLASKICKPRKPSCERCPLCRVCSYGVVVLSSGPRRT